MLKSIKTTDKPITLDVHTLEDQTPYFTAKVDSDKILNVTIYVNAIKLTSKDAEYEIPFTGIVTLDNAHDGGDHINMTVLSEGAAALLTSFLSKIL